jgi:hypothetical protein
MDLGSTAVAMQRAGLYADKGRIPSAPVGATETYLHCKKLQFIEIYSQEHWNSAKNKSYT